MDVNILNAVMLPLLATLVIPDAVRDRNTGEFLGFTNPLLVFYCIALCLLEIFLVSGERGFGLEAIRIGIHIAVVCMVGGIAFAYFTHKENFGEKLDFRSRKRK